MLKDKTQNIWIQIKISIRRESNLIQFNKHSIIMLTEEGGYHYNVYT